MICDICVNVKIYICFVGEERINLEVTKGLVLKYFYLEACELSTQSKQTHVHVDKLTYGSHQLGFLGGVRHA
jgi:hypothetical protein